MAEPMLDIGLQLAFFGAMFVGVAVAFLLLFRIIDYFAADDIHERYGTYLSDQQIGTADDNTGQHGEENIRTGGDEVDETSDVRCPRCGTYNDPEYTFCQECQARVGSD